MDTNVWVSALLNASGPPAAIVTAWEQGLFAAVVPEMVLDEIRDVLGRDRIRLRIGSEPGLELAHGPRDRACQHEGDPAPQFTPVKWIPQRRVMPLTIERHVDPDLTMCHVMG